MTTKTFSTAAVLTAIHDRLLCPFAEVHELLDWLADEPLMTHQLPRVSDEAAPFLREWFPDLAATTIPAALAGDEAVLAYVAALHDRLGPTRDVPHLPAADHTRIHPLQELQMMRPDMQIVVADLPDPKDLP